MCLTKAAELASTLEPSCHLHACVLEEQDQLDTVIKLKGTLLYGFLSVSFDSLGSTAPSSFRYVQFSLIDTMHSCSGNLSLWYHLAVTWAFSIPALSPLLTCYWLMHFWGHMVVSLVWMEFIFFVLCFLRDRAILGHRYHRPFLGLGMFCWSPSSGAKLPPLSMTLLPLLKYVTGSLQ